MSHTWLLCCSGGTWDAPNPLRCELSLASLGTASALVNIKWALSQALVHLYHNDCNLRCAALRTAADGAYEASGLAGTTCGIPSPYCDFSPLSCKLLSGGTRSKVQPSQVAVWDLHCGEPNLLGERGALPSVVAITAHAGGLMRAGGCSNH